MTTPRNSMILNNSTNSTLTSTRNYYTLLGDDSTDAQVNVTTLNTIITFNNINYNCTLYLYPESEMDCFVSADIPEYTTYVPRNVIFRDSSIARVFVTPIGDNIILTTYHTCIVAEVFTAMQTNAELLYTADPIIWMVYYDSQLSEWHESYTRQQINIVQLKSLIKGSILEHFDEGSDEDSSYQDSHPESDNIVWQDNPLFGDDNLMDQDGEVLVSPPPYTYTDISLAESTYVEESLFDRLPTPNPKRDWVDTKLQDRIWIYRIDEPYNNGYESDVTEEDLYDLFGEYSDDDCPDLFSRARDSTMSDIELNPDPFHLISETISYSVSAKI